MDRQGEAADFLKSRRARVTPDRVGLPAGGNRRVAGLRRSEVAMLAGVSVEYYTKLERGAVGGASAEVLDSVARALLMDDAERAHLFHLARTSLPPFRQATRRRDKPWVPHESLQWLLDAITEAPAFVGNGRMDLLVANALGRAFYCEIFDMPGTPNFARYTFLDDRAHDFYPNWDSVADTTVAILRTEAARDQCNKALHDIIGELSTRSEEFRRRWAAHDVRIHGTGSKAFHHPVVGEMVLAFETLELVSSPGMVMTAYSAEPGSPTAERMRLLASWAATGQGASEVDAKTQPFTG